MAEPIPPHAEKFEQAMVDAIREGITEALRLERATVRTQLLNFADDGLTLNPDDLRELVARMEADDWTTGPTERRSASLG